MPTSSVTSLILTSPSPLIEHPAQAYLDSLSPGSEPTMRQSLNLVAQILTNGQANYLTLNWAALRYKHTAAVRAALLMENYEPATVNKTLCALRRVLKEALKLELLTPQDYARAVDIESVKARKDLSGRALSQSEIDTLMQACYSDRTPLGYRDAALVAILRGAGLRRAEAVALNLADFNPNQDGELKIRCGKGRVDRTVYLSAGAISIVQQWIEIRTNADGPLLCHVNKSGRVLLQRLSPASVLFILNKRGQEAQIQHFSPHDLRRTFASDLLDAGVDISTVQRLMGHETPTLTVRYDRRGESPKRNAVQLLPLPQR